MPLTPPTAPPGALSFSVADSLQDGFGAVSVSVTAIADGGATTDQSEYITFTGDPGGAALSVLEITGIGDHGGTDPDTLRFDLTSFDDDFELQLVGAGAEDTLIFEGVDASTDNPDGSVTIQFTGADGFAHVVTVEPSDADIQVYFAPDGQVDGSSESDLMDVGYMDARGDQIDGSDGPDDVIMGYAGNDTINGGIGNDTIYGESTESPGLTPPDLGLTGGLDGDTAPAAPGSGLNFTIDDSLVDGAGDASVRLTTDVPGASFDRTVGEYVTFSGDPGGAAMDSLRIGGIGDAAHDFGGPDEDVLHFDLSTFDDDFEITIGGAGAEDRIVFSDADDVVENDDGTTTVQYTGSDAQTHFVTIFPGRATIETYGFADPAPGFDDLIDAAEGDDFVDGGYGEDTISGGDGADTLLGNQGADTIYGGGGADVISGDFGINVEANNSGPALAAGADDHTLGDSDFATDGSVSVNLTTDVTGTGDSSADSEDVTFHDDPDAFADDLTAVRITGIGSGADDADVIRFDLGEFDDDFDIALDSAGSDDSLVITGATDVIGNDDGTTTIHYTGSDGQPHTVTIQATDAQVYTYGDIDPADFANDGDLLVGGDGDDTIDGGYGNDTLEGGTGDDLLYGDGPNIPAAEPTVRESFEWDLAPDSDGSISNNDAMPNFTQDTGSVAVTFTIASTNETPSSAFTTETENTDGIDSGGETIDPNSGLWSFLDSNEEAAVYRLDFSNPVQNVDFRISDIDIDSRITVTAYDADGNPIPVTLTAGDNLTLTDTDAVAGDDSASSDGANAPGAIVPGYSMLVEIQGPVARIEVNHVQEGSHTSGVTVSDVYFDVPVLVDGADRADWIKGDEGSDTIDGGDGDDTIDAGDDNDTIVASVGNDSIGGGAGIDTYTTNGATTLTDEQIAVTIDKNGDGTVDKIGDGSTDTLSSVEAFSASNVDGQDDEITFTDDIRLSMLETDLTGIDKIAAVGTFTPEGGSPISFGGSGEPTLAEILNGTYDPGSGPVAPQGAYRIESGDEDGKINGISFEEFEIINFDIVCFVRGTMIETNRGEVAVEDLGVGDMVETMDNGAQPIRWIGSTRVPGLGRLAPILIRKGALGNTRDLRLSPQHRLLLQGWRTQLHFGEDEVLATAKSLVNDDSILPQECPEVEYFHMLFDAHQIVFSEGVATESYHPGQTSLDGMGEHTRAEIFELFPQLEGDADSYGRSARLALKFHEGRVIA